jgi:hypothetical protein
MNSGRIAVAPRGCVARLAITNNFTTGLFMKRPKHILARDDGGTQVVILEIEAEAGGQPAHYELANRSKVDRISDTEFVVIETGRLLTRTVPQRR